MDWPPHLDALVDLYGETADYAAGLELLGYPPTWTETVSELLRGPGMAAKIEQFFAANPKEKRIHEHERMGRAVRGARL